MMARNTTRSNQRPDTLMQDRICQVDETSCNARPDHTFGSITSPGFGAKRQSRNFSIRLLAQLRVRTAEIGCRRILADLDDAAADGAGAAEMLEQCLAVI